MGIITTTQSITPKLLKFERSFLHFDASIRTSLRFPIISGKPRITTCSLADESTFNTATKVAVEDPFFAVKNKAADISPELKGTSIFLIGMNNAIKTDLGKLLAEVLRYYYFDSDSLVFEAAGGESAAKAFRESDEKGYRQAETEVLKQLSSMGRLVVCAGNGAVQSSTNLYEIAVIAELAACNFFAYLNYCIQLECTILYDLLYILNRALLRYGISLWIDVPLDMVARTDQSKLPASELSALYIKMRDGYATADATVSLQKVASQLGYEDLDAVTTEDLTLEVLKEIERLTRAKKMMEEAARPF